MAMFLDMKEEYDNWINRFYRGIFNKPYMSEEYKRWLIIKNSHLPSSLFQYTSVKYSYYLLMKDLMFINQFNKLNDPFEANFLHDFDLYQKKGMLLEVDESYKERYRVACFSQDNDNAPMWAFYGDNHEGICIEYDFHRNNLFRDFCYPVQYVKRTDNTNLAELLLDGKDPLNASALELFVKKSHNWSYEKEWRLVFDDEHDYEGIDFIMKNDKMYVEFLKPKAVYMGLKISPEDEDYILDLCNSRNIEVYKMYEDSSQYNLMAKKV